MRPKAAWLCCAALAAPAQAQTGGWMIEVDGVVSPSNPTVTVEVWAWWDHVPGVAEIFTSGRLDLLADEAGWRDVTCPVSPWIPPCGEFTRIIGPRIDELGPGQLWIPSLGLIPDPGNPILAVRAQWTTQDFTPRAVGVVTTDHLVFNVFGDSPGVITAIHPVVAGQGVIRVVPSPGILAVLGLGGLFACRRRR